MDTELLMKLVNGEKVPERDIENALYEVCCDVHSSCSDECPVHKKNGSPLGCEKDWQSNRGCDCFKNGKAMLAFLRKK